MASKPPPPRPRRNRVNKAETTLVCLVQALEGRKLVIELRNDTVIRGTIEAVDDYLNITLTDVSSKNVQGVNTEYEFMYLKGRNIRFIHFPKSLDPAQAIEAKRKEVVQAKLDHLKERLRNQQPRAAKGIDTHADAPQDSSDSQEDED